LKNLLYIGNKLSAHGSNKTAIETLGPLLEQEGFAITYASAKKNKIARLAEMVWKTIAHSRKTDYLLIDTYSTYNFWYALVVSQISRILRIKYIPILHGGNLPKRLLISPRLCKMIFRHSYFNVAPSNYLLSVFEKAGFKNTVFIPNAIKINDYKFKQRKDLRPKLFWVRSFAEIYNPEMALRVLEAVKQDFPEAVLCMVGPDKKGWLDKIRLLAEQRKLEVKFTGKLSRKAWTKLSEDYDIFINTTHFDNTPVSVIEAMALGLPVVSTNVGGLPFLLENHKTGLLVNDDDAVQMAACIKELLHNESLADLMASGARQHVQDFDSEKVKRKWLEILK